MRDVYDEAMMGEGHFKRSSAGASDHLRLPDGVKRMKINAERGVPLVKRLAPIPYVVSPAVRNNECEPGYLFWLLNYVCHKVFNGIANIVVCPAAMAKRRCAFCEWRSQAQRQSGLSKDDREMLDKLKPKDMQLYNMLDMDAPNEGVQLWDIAQFNFGKMYASTLAALFPAGASPPHPQRLPHHPKHGFILQTVFEKTEARGDRRKPDAKQIDPFTQATRIDWVPRGPLSREVLEQALVLEDLLIVPSYEETYRAFWGEDPPADGSGHPAIKTYSAPAGNGSAHAARPSRQEPAVQQPLDPRDELPEVTLPEQSRRAAVAPPVQQSAPAPAQAPVQSGCPFKAGDFVTVDGDVTGRDYQVIKCTAAGKLVLESEDGELHDEAPHFSACRPATGLPQQAPLPAPAPEAPRQRPRVTYKGKQMEAVSISSDGRTCRLHWPEGETDFEGVPVEHVQGLPQHPALAQRAQKAQAPAPEPAPPAEILSLPPRRPGRG